MVLPGAFPNLLANGSQGIAVGMATAIPPHNAHELCDAALFLIDNPNARATTLLKYVQGPDFPTGGMIVDPREAIAEAYATGRGSFRVRARWHKEETGRGTYQIVITRNSVAGAEAAADRADGRAVQREEAAADRRLPRRVDRGRAHRDRAASRARSMPALLMESLFKLTELESRIPLNMNVLSRARCPR